MLINQLPDDIIAIIGADIIKIESLSGGSISQAEKIITPNETFLLKHAREIPPALYPAEAEGLNIIDASNTFNTPEILWFNEQFLLMRFIEQDSKLDWGQLGTQLALMHQQQHPQYGFVHNNYFATLPQNNTWQTHWLMFYREQRLRPLIQQPLLNSHDKIRLEKLLDKLGEYLDNSEPPALIHGDLWYANIIFNQHGIYLIDPAAYYASREIEIVYLEFVGDSHELLLQRYQHIYPLSTDYAERKNFYLLYPYLCHLRLYGDRYLPGLQNLLDYLI